MERKIIVSVDPNVNYVFHMLSTALCGYDNAYGEKYRQKYDQDDLKYLKEQETHLIVKGGEGCGDWYELLVCLAAEGKMPAEEYYRGLKLSPRLSLRDDSLEINATCQIMMKYYEDYTANIWPWEKEALKSYGARLQSRFDQNGFAQKAEALVGVSLPSPFRAELVSSIEGGAEAIDISTTQDVFGIARPIDSEVSLISHEFIIFLLKIALRGEDAFGSSRTWKLTEGLAEFYLYKITGNCGLFEFCKEQVETYLRLEHSFGTNAVALYRAASNGA